MLGDVRKAMRVGIEALANQRPDELIARVQGLADQMASFAAGLVEWSAEARASLTREIKDLVARQAQEIGVATRPDLEAVRARLDHLEKVVAATAGVEGTGQQETKRRPRQESKRARSPARTASSRAGASPKGSSRSTRSGGGSGSGRSASRRTGSRTGSPRSSASGPG